MSDSYDRFFDVIEDFGFFDPIYARLPEDFTAVYEIARVLENAVHPLAAQLAPVLRVHAPTGIRPEAPPREEEAIAIVEEPVEYEAGHIRNPRDLTRIYNHQWLLPDEVFDRRLAAKGLWVPYPKAPTYYGVEPESDEYAPDERKQKLYILLDTSSSMTVRRRIHLAKALVYVVLRRNLRELGAISLRTFDVAIGPLHTAEDRQSYHALLRTVMRHDTFGNGTAMAAAIRCAVRDITERPHLAGAEILVVTDGACTLNEDEIRQLLGDSVAINTVKIGKAKIHASDGWIVDKLAAERSPQYPRVKRLVEQAAELRRQRDGAQSPAHKRRAAASLAYVERELHGILGGLEETVVGRELERLSDVHIEVADLDLAALVAPDRDRCAELAALFDALRAEMEVHQTADQQRRLAVLAEHVRFLLSCAAEGDTRGALRRLADDIGNVLDERRESGTAMHAEPWPAMGSEERRDIGFLRGISVRSLLPNWKRMLRMLRYRLRRLVRRLLR